MSKKTRPSSRRGDVGISDERLWPGMIGLIRATYLEFDSIKLEEVI